MKKLHMKICNGTCAVGHAAVFAVNAALVASQWQQRAWSLPLHPLINASLWPVQRRWTGHKHVPLCKSSIWPNRESIRFYHL